MQRYIKLLPLVIIRFIISSFLLDSSQGGELRVGFYSESCPNAEATVRMLVGKASVSDENISPALLRLHFHDCFVQGCDGSILIDDGAETDERHAFGHQGVRGFDVVERAKAELEKICPRTVSCADIVAMAARDAVFWSKGPWYEVETGRRDGIVSNVTLADEMPDVGDNVQELKAKFFAKGLNEKDLVLLSASHTIGTTACFFMTQRLYTFPAPGGIDPSITQFFVPELKSACPRDGDVNVRLALDRGSEKRFDAQILHNIRSGLAVLQSDAGLYQDVVTRRVVDSYLRPLGPLLGPSFQVDFASSMVKMGRIGVLTGSKGTIRSFCSSIK